LYNLHNNTLMWLICLQSDSWPGIRPRCSPSRHAKEGRKCIHPHVQCVLGIWEEVCVSLSVV